MVFDDFKSSEGRAYRIASVTGVMNRFENVGHQLAITGTAAYPQVECLTGGHGASFGNLRFEAAEGVLRGELRFQNETLKVILSAIVPKQKIQCLLDGTIEPGSWTAEDPGVGGGTD